MRKIARETEKKIMPQIKNTLWILISCNYHRNILILLSSTFYLFPREKNVISTIWS